MVNPTYLTRSRHNVYYFRWPIPKTLHPSGAATDIKVSLGTRNPRKALQLSRLLVYSAQQFTLSEAGHHMDYADIRATLTKVFADGLKSWKNRIDQSGPLTASDETALENTVWLADEFLESGLSLTSESEENATLRQFSAKYNMGIEEGTPAWEHLRKEIHRAHRSCCQKVLEYNKSMGDYALESNNTPTMKSSAVNTEDISLHALIGKYIEEQVRGDNWTNKTKLQQTARFGLLEEILSPALPSSQITVELARQVKDTLCKVPKNRSKNPKTRDLPLAQAVEIPDVERLGVPTINKHLALYDSLFSWAKSNQYVEHSPFHGLALKKSKRQDNSRAHFSPEQLALIYAMLTADHAQTPRKDYQKWGVLIGMFTGARLNEIAQLQVSDIRQEDGIWFFDINDEPEEARLKTKASKRKVPIHSRLLGLGLLEYVEKVKSRNEDRLLYELSYTKGNGYGRNLGRWFNEKFLPSLAIKKDNLVFHSFRHTVVTQLLQNNAEGPVVKAIVGHTQEGVTYETYFKGFKIQQLKDAIELITI